MNGAWRTNQSKANRTPRNRRWRLGSGLVVMDVKPRASALAPADGAGKRLIVEGWRFLPHSYAIVNEWQLLALLRRKIDLKVVDVPFHRPSWQALMGLFEPSEEQALRSIDVAQPAESADVTLRVFFPLNFSPSRSRLTAVFATLEQQLIRKFQVSDWREYEQLRRGPPPANVKAVTPSRWSAEGFYRAGFDRDQVLVVPHGVDTGTFHPMPDIRKHVRSGMPVLDGEFVFLSVGAMTGNKGIDLLLRAFAEVCRKFPHARLVLKGMDHLYDSRALLPKSIRTLSAGDQQLVLQRMTYLGDSLSHSAMATLYQVADAYVSPYRAEGFNLPVLEAAACGIPIICTRGGPTDDFVTDEFARRIDSRTFVFTRDGQLASQLDPSLEHLIVLMTSAIEDSAWRKHAAEAGPRHVRARYTWDCAVDTLIGKLLN
jgi:glycosyltransferase involved in cell wall biosynthesis